jgi:hypothetical protein
MADPYTIYSSEGVFGRAIAMAKTAPTMTSIIEQLCVTPAYLVRETFSKTTSSSR